MEEQTKTVTEKKKKDHLAHLRLDLKEPSRAAIKVRCVAQYRTDLVLSHSCRVNPVDNLY